MDLSIHLSAVKGKEKYKTERQERFFGEGSGIV